MPYPAADNCGILKVEKERTALIELSNMSSSRYLDRASGAGPSQTAFQQLGFTLLECLVAISIIVVLMGLLFSMINQSSIILQRTQNDVASFQSARFAFNLIGRALSQSRIRVYDDYDNASQPTTYLRNSNLNFVVAAPPCADFGQGNGVFFQAPIGRTLNSSTYGRLTGLLNSVGYFVTYGKDPNLPPFLQKYDRNRFRLLQFLAPSEEMAAYTSGTTSAWYTGDSTLTPGSKLLDTYSSVIADNIILFLCWPRLSKQQDAVGNSLTSDYHYNSRDGVNINPQPVTANQQPPLVQVTFVAIDKVSANRLADSATPPEIITGMLTGLFGTSTEADYKQDMGKLEKRLINARIGYQIFSGMVPLRETKWSK